jgi:hypothetical protein
VQRVRRESRARLILDALAVAVLPLPDVDGAMRRTRIRARHAEGRRHRRAFKLTRESTWEPGSTRRCSGDESPEGGHLLPPVLRRVRRRSRR